MNNQISNQNVDEFFESIAQIIEQARRFVGRTADLTMCITYFEIGRRIVEKEQDGKARAEYGKGLLVNLSDYLNAKFGRGYSVTTLKNARRFYTTYSLAVPNDSSDTQSSKRQTLFALFEDELSTQKRQTLFDQLYPFKLSWSHYLILMRIENEDARHFYEIEAFQQQWTFRQLQRQYGSSLYERLALSRNKDEVIRLANEGQVIEKSRDLLKNPLVLEFLDLDESFAYSENDLESAIINKLSNFLLELGKGFLYEGRQKRFTFNEDHFRVDLVFYNRLLSCYILFDIKIDKLTHQDLGQMSMYVNYFDRYIKTDNENPTVGILLCKEKNDSVVELTLPKIYMLPSTAYTYPIRLYYNAS